MSDLENMSNEHTPGRMPSKETENSPEKRLETWTNKVSLDMDTGEVLGAVHARTNYSLSVKNSGEYSFRPLRDSGYNSEVMNRNVDNNQADRIYHALLNYDQNTGRSRVDDGELNVTIASLDDIEEKAPARRDDVRDVLRPLVKNKLLVEFRYKQPLGDENSRTPTKHVYLVLSADSAQEIHEIIDSGVSPKSIHNSLARIFTDDQSLPYFDVTLMKEEKGKLVPTNHPHTQLEKTMVQVGENALNLLVVGEERKHKEPEIIIKKLDQTKTGKNAEPAIWLDESVDNLDEEDDFVFDDDFDVGDDDDFDFGDNDNESAGSPPSGPPPPPENGPTSPEHDFSGITFVELNRRIIDKTTKEDELGSLLQERVKRAEGNMEFLNPLYLGARDILAREGNTRDSRAKILQVARELEETARREDPNYPENDQGIISAAGAGLTNRLDYLEAKEKAKLAPNRLQILRETSRRTHFLRGVIESDQIGSEKPVEHARPQYENGGSRLMRELLQFRDERTGVIDLENQRRVVRRRLNYLEKSGKSSNPVYGYTIPEEFLELQSSLELMHPEIAKECRMRLSLLDASVSVGLGGGYMGRREGGQGITIPDGVSQAQARDHGVEGEQISFFLKKGEMFRGERELGMERHAVELAWDLLQDANFEYGRLVRETNTAFGSNYNPEGRVRFDDEYDLGSAPANYFTDQDPTRKGGVTDYIKSQLQSKIFRDRINEELVRREINSPTRNAILDIAQEIRGNTQIMGEIIENAETSLRLAEELNMATFQNPVFNSKALTGKDDIATFLNFGEFRTTREGPGRKRGPDVTIAFIPGYGSDFLRLEASGLRDEYDDATGKVTRSISKPLHAADIDPNKIQLQAWATYGTSTAIKWYSLSDLLMQTNPDIGSIDTDFLTNAVDYFNKADPADKSKDPKYHHALNLRFWWVTGVLDTALWQAINNPDKVRWTPDDINHLELVMTKMNLSMSAGPFISKEQWDYALKLVGYYEIVDPKTGRKGEGKLSRLSKVRAYRAVMGKK